MHVRKVLLFVQKLLPVIEYNTNVCLVDLKYDFALPCYYNLIIQTTVAD